MSQTTPAILWLDDPACRDIALVGGKAASLAQLTADHNVPPGFCVTAAALGPVGEEPLLPGEPGHASADPTSADARHGLAASLLLGVSAAYAELAHRCRVDLPRVAVRSSAVDEDGATASFAGQYDTYLNIVGAEAVAAAIDRCVASARSSRAAAYRAQRPGLARAGPSAVLVQLLVDAEVSAVAFSANPVTGARDEIIINACWGLGEAVVGGLVTPDAVTVTKADLTIVDRELADKDVMVVPGDQGTRPQDVPEHLRTAPVLTDVQAAEIGELARSLERSLKRPVDVECAFAGGKLYLLQCRPITTLRD